MNVINSVLKTVKKDSNGFDDIQSFWTASDKLSFPLGKQVKSSLFKLTTPSTPKQAAAEDSEQEFNYDTSTSITDDEEDDAEEQESESEDEQPSDHDEPNASRLSSVSLRTDGSVKSLSKRQSAVSSNYSPLNQSLRSIGLSPLGTEGSYRSSLASSNRDSIVSRNRDSMVSSHRDSMASSNRDSVGTSSSRDSTSPSRRDTLETVKSSGRKSISSTANTSGRRDTIESAISPGGYMNESGFDADKSNEMLDASMLTVPTQSALKKSKNKAIKQTSPITKQNSTVMSNDNNTANDTIPTTPTASVRDISRSKNGENSISLTGGSEGGLLSKSIRSSADPNRSARRVSFPDSLGDLSPIAGTESQPATASSRKSKASRSSFASSVAPSSTEKEQSRNTSVDQSSVHSSRNTSVDNSRNTSINQSSVHSRNTSVNQSSRNTSVDQSSIQESTQYSPDDQDNEQPSNDFGDDYGDHNDDDMQEEIEESEDVSRIMSQTDTPITNKSMNRSILSSGLKTPYSDIESNISTNSVRRLTLPTPGSHDFVRGTAVLDETYMEDEDSGIEDTDDEADTSAVITPAGRKYGKKNITTEEEDELDDSTMLEGASFIDNSFLHTIDSGNKKYVEGRKMVHDRVKPSIGTVKRGIKHKLYSSDEEDHNLQDTSEEDSEEGTEGLRRSRRATKGRRFAYWKGERPIYEEGTMVGLITAEPTPKKPKRSGKHVGRPKLHKTKDQEDEQDEEIIQSKLPPIVLPKKVKYISREECEELEVWDENTENSTTLRVICPTETLQPPMQLPRTARRPPGRDKLGYAAHSFNVAEVPGKESGWIAGFVELPPEAIKDPEGVGRYTQVFFVSECQDGALELGLAHPDQDRWDDHTAQRMLLKKGDSFYVPPCNIYRLENHSTVKSCKLFWTIIKPIEQAVAEENTTAMEENSPSSTHVVAGGVTAGGGGEYEEDM